MGIEFARRNPGIESFQTGMTNAGRRRALDDENYRRNVEFGNEQATDAALRQGIGAYYADQPQANQPAPPGVSAAAQPVATPAPPPAQFSAPAPTNVADGFGDAQRLPPDQQGAPAPAATPTGTFATPAVRAAPRNTAFGNAMRTLARAPGGGRTMMAMHQQDQQGQRSDAQENRRLQHDGQVLWLKAIDAGDLRMAQHIGQQYGLQLPPDIYTNRKSLTDVKVATNTAKSLGITDDMMAVSFVDAYVDARQKGADEGTATRAATAAVKSGASGPGKAVHWAVDDAHQVTGFDARGTPIRTGVKARPLKHEMGGGGGAADGAGGSKQQQFAKWRIDTLVASGVPLPEAQKMVAGGSANKPVTGAQRLAAANRLLGSTDRMGRKLYPDLNAALKAIDSATSGAGGPAPAAPQPGAEAPAGAPAPAAQASGATPKRLKFNTSTFGLDPVTAQ